MTNYPFSINLKIVGLLFFLILSGCEKADVPAENDSSKSASMLSDVIKGPVNPIQLDGDLSDVFMLGSDFTDLQRENTAMKVIGTNVVWELPVYEVSQDKGVYKVITKSGLMTGDLNRKLLNATVFIYPQSDDDRMRMEALKTNDLIEFKGRVADIRLRSLVVVNPAILVKNEASPRSRPKNLAEGETMKRNRDEQSRWREIGNNEPMDVTTYIDISTKRKNDGMARIWRLDNYSESATSEQTFRSSTYLSEFDCDHEETRVTSDNYFSGPMGTGTPLKVDNKPTPWVPVAPNTVGALAMQVACEP